MKQFLYLISLVINNTVRLTEGNQCTLIIDSLYAWNIPNWINFIRIKESLQTIFMTGFKIILHLESDSSKVSSPKSRYINKNENNEQMLPKMFLKSCIFQCICFGEHIFDTEFLTVNKISSRELKLCKFE